MPKLDLNLLATLDSVLEQRSVTKAAKRLGMSQPAVSLALARLRQHFNDQLIYRTSGNTYQLTPLALSLAGRTAAAMSGARQVLELQPSFDPQTCEREFVIVSSDYGATVVGVPLTASLGRLAPRVAVRLVRHTLGPFTEDKHRSRSVDGVIMPHGLQEGLPHLDLFRDRWVCVVAADNRLVGDNLTLSDLERLRWVTNFPQPWPVVAMQQLARRGLQLRVQIEVDTFLRVPEFIFGSDRIALMPYRLAQVRDGLRIMRCPFDADPIVQAFWWHPIFERDLEHAWLRDQFARTSSAVLGGLTVA